MLDFSVIFFSLSILIESTSF